MNDEISAAITKLKADAVGVVFTGFVTNADVVLPAMLKGEVWGHVRADGVGRFADGHRIETSDIVQIHSNRDSLWVSTRSGSNYGILWFAPLGWTFLTRFHQDRQQLHLMPPDSPPFEMINLSYNPPRLAKRIRERLISGSVSVSRKVPTGKLRVSQATTAYVENMGTFIQNSIEIFQKKSVKMPQ